MYILGGSVYLKLRILISGLIVIAIILVWQPNKEVVEPEVVYLIGSASDEVWNCSGGQLTVRGSMQEFKYYGVRYIGEEDFSVDRINVLFYISSGVDGLQNGSLDGTVLHSFSESSNKKLYIGEDYSLGGGSSAGEILNMNLDYSLDKIFMEITYIKDGENTKDIIELPMKIRGES